MFEHILAAEKRLKGYSHVTPIMVSRTLDRMVGAEVFFKCENFQRIGAFKFRGAFNSISQLSEPEKSTRRHHLFLGQSCPGRRFSREDAEYQNDHRDAEQCPCNQTGRH
jgi:threonine dehydratase